MPPHAFRMTQLSSQGSKRWVPVYPVIHGGGYDIVFVRKVSETPSLKVAQFDILWTNFIFGSPILK